MELSKALKLEVGDVVRFMPKKNGHEDYGNSTRKGPITFRVISRSSAPDYPENDYIWVSCIECSNWVFYCRNQSDAAWSSYRIKTIVIPSSRLL